MRLGLIVGRLRFSSFTLWQATLSPHLPAITAGAVPALFAQMLAVASSSPSIAHDLDPKMKPSAFDWFIHPGGPAILSALSADLDLADPSEDPTQTAPSWQIFRERGNASSASIGAVVERGRTLGGRPLVVGVAFGPGVSVEMTLLRRVGR
jgi:type III polyketide synthase